MNWLLVPLADRAIVRRIVRAIDVLLGYPRTLADNEVTWHGGKPPSALPIRTETQCAVLLGATHIAVSVDAIVQALVGRQITIDAQQVTVTLTRAGWSVVETLPAGTWTPLPPRDGGAGSTTGVPVP
jgi:hypothetical protein